MHGDHELKKELEYIVQLLYKVLINQEVRIMPALDTAQAALQQLTADVNALLARPVGGVPEADVQKIADDLAALDALVKAALGV